METNTEFASLPLGGVPRAVSGWKRKVNTAAFIFALFAGGFGTGFIYSQRQAESFLTQTRSDHLSEITRLQRAHELVIGSLATNAVKATETAATATATAATATESAAEATKNAAAATGQAAKAVESSTVHRLKR